jgi:hypothetical protein
MALEAEFTNQQAAALILVRYTNEAAKKTQRLNAGSWKCQKSLRLSSA